MADYSRLYTDEEQPHSPPPPPLPPPPSSAVKTTTPRVASLDVFRGLCVFLMMLVDYGGSIFPTIAHAPWNGLHLADFVMPFFLFIAGLSLAISYKRVTDRIDATKKAIARPVKLFLLGVFLQGGYLHGAKSLTYGVDILKIRWMGILQRISIAYVVAALCEIWLPCRKWKRFRIVRSYIWQWCVVGILCAVYSGLLYGLFVPDWHISKLSLSISPSNSTIVHEVKCGLRGDLSPACNSAGMIDRYVLGICHLYAKPAYGNLKECNKTKIGIPESSPSWCHAPFDPEGILGSLTAAVTCIIGLQFGHILVQMQDHKERLHWWSMLSIYCSMLGVLLAILAIFRQIHLGLLLFSEDFCPEKYTDTVMQGQKGTIGSLPDSINFDYESSTANVDIDQQICWNNLRNPSESRLSDYRISASSSDNTFMGSVSQEGQTLSRWNSGEASSHSPQNLVGHGEQLTQIGWSPPINISVGAGLRLNETANFVSQPTVNLNLSTNQIADEPAFMRGSSSGSASHNFDLNEGRFHRVGNDMGGLNSSKLIGFESKFHPSSGSLPDPFASSSGSGGLFVEDADGRPGCSMDGRRVSCKRKTLEGNPGQSSSEGNFFLRAEGSMWRVIPPQFDTSSSMNIAATPDISSSIHLHEEVNPRLGLGMGGRVPGDNIRSINVSDGPESSHRNYRLRMNPSVQPVSLSNNPFLPLPTGVTRHFDVPSVHQPLRFAPMNSPLDLMSPIPLDISRPHNQSVATMQRIVQSHRWNTLRTGSSSISAVSGDRDDVLPDDSSSRNLPRNIGEHPMFAPPVDARSWASHPTNWSPSSVSIGIPRNTVSSSRSGTNPGSHSSGGPSRASHRHPTSQYSRRLSEYVRRSLLSAVGSDIAGQISSNSQHRPIPVSSQDGVLPSSGGNQEHNHSQSRSTLWRERQGDAVGGIPYLRALAAAGEGRSRLVSEIRNALDLLRRGEGLRIEDIMLLDQSVYFGRAEIHDQHRDMRLDVDNMSYEELLALEERIGNVCTGLSEETILKCLKQCKHVHTMSHDQTEAEPCCVCQEIYRDGEDIGTLDCGHAFHTECIKQWLSQKNVCPICKTTGLST